MRTVSSDGGSLAPAGAGPARLGAAVAALAASLGGAYAVARQPVATVLVLLAVLVACLAAFRLPVRAWKEMMELYYPDTNWLCLRRDVFDRLYRYKMRLGLPTWEQALERLLDTSGGGVES